MDTIFFLASFRKVLRCLASAGADLHRTAEDGMDAFLGAIDRTHPLVLVTWRIIPVSK